MSADDGLYRLDWRLAQDKHYARFTEAIQQSPPDEELALEALRSALLCERMEELYERPVRNGHS